MQLIIKRIIAENNNIFCNNVFNDCRNYTQLIFQLILRT